ncbi:MAG: HAMP domain-containing histidine kinase, partial [Anaerolineae bacterium]|nr:HAMP domain-containing histidine kinase [Anaerolineae bacterium]
FKVRDYGRGIPKADFENIWDELYQINREHYEDQGSGCGLAIVDGAVKIHGGSRNVESEGIGNGSTFTIRIPVTPPDNPDSYEAFDGIASMMSQ